MIGSSVDLHLHRLLPPGLVRRVAEQLRLLRAPRQPAGRRIHHVPHAHGPHRLPAPLPPARAGAARLRSLRGMAAVPAPPALADGAVDDDIESLRHQVAQLQVPRSERAARALTAGCRQGGRWHGGGRIEALSHAARAEGKGERGGRPEHRQRHGRAVLALVPAHACGDDHQRA